jgi:glutathione synthase/RimK-type ligase-like ATP-grasp enzyme
MSKIWILTRNLDEKQAEDICNKGQKNCLLENYTPTSIRMGFKELGIDVKTVKLRDINTFGTIPDMAIDCYPPWSKTETEKLFWLESQGVVVLNKPKYHSKYHNKWYQARQLINSNVNIPNTIEIPFPPTIEKLNDIDRLIGYPIVVKPTISGFGIMVTKCHTEDEVFDACLKIFGVKKSQLGFTPSSSIIAQKWIDHKFIGIIRIFVIGYKAIAAQQRKANSEMDFFISNDRPCSIRNQFEITKELSDLCESACRSLNLDFALLDVLHDGKTFSICEVNTMGNFKAIDDANPKINCGLEIAKYSLTKMNLIK